MSINFPNSPYLNQTYVFGNITWAWNGSAWDKVSTASGYLGATGATPTDFVASINGLTGAVGITAGHYIQVTQSGNTFTVSGVTVIHGGVF
jgi:hypothetical protein